MVGGERRLHGWDPCGRGLDWSFGGFGASLAASPHWHSRRGGSEREVGGMRVETGGR